MARSIMIKNQFRKYKKRRKNAVRDNMYDKKRSI